MQALEPARVVADIVSAAGLCGTPISWREVDAVPGPAIEIRVLTRELSGEAVGRIVQRARALGLEAVVDPPYRARGARITLFPGR